MPERLRAIIDKIIQWWKKFTVKQKTLIGSIAALVVVALVILAVVVTRPTNITLRVCENATEASAVVDLLEGENIWYETSSDGLTISVHQKDEAKAHILLGSNSISSDGYSLDDVFNGSFSTTEADKSKKYQLYLEQKIADELCTIESIDDAKVELSIPDNDGTILSQQEDTYASVLLTLNTELTEDEAVGIAKYVATAVGDDTTENILVLDSTSNLLYSGADSASSSSGNYSASQMAIKQKAESDVKSQVSDVMLGSTVYDNVEVGLNLSMDFSEKEVVDTEYSVADGNTQGYLDSETTYSEETQGGYSGVPGTDSNDETTYVIDTDDYTYSTIEESTKDYLPNSKVTKTKTTGTVEIEESSMAVVATTYVVYDEASMKASGQLADTTFDEFVAANSDKVQVEVDEEYYTLLSNATGIPVESISVMAYEVPFFQYDTSSASITDYLQFIIAAIILIMLGFVIFRSTRSAAEETELEPELSVEGLLESTKDEEGIDSIEYQEGSETKRMIENFIDQNPVAAASLLRNWIEEGEEWG